ncbi:MAG: hypothetical protein ACNS62_17540 [Candidatus Cyclobacteriaceae bacterium M3_2C_046]
MKKFRYSVAFVFLVLIIFFQFADVRSFSSNISNSIDQIRMENIQPLDADLNSQTINDHQENKSTINEDYDIEEQEVSILSFNFLFNLFNKLALNMRSF